MKTFRTAIVGAVGALVALAVVGVALFNVTGAKAQLDNRDFACAGLFRVETYAPDGARVAALQGRLAMRVSISGKVNGAVSDTATGQLIANVEGSITGRNVSIVLEQADGEQFFGVGSTRYDPSECRGVMAGNAVYEKNERFSAGGWIFRAE